MTLGRAFLAGFPSSKESHFFAIWQRRPPKRLQLTHFEAFSFSFFYVSLTLATINVFLFVQLTGFLLLVTSK